MSCVFPLTGRRRNSPLICRFPSRSLVLSTPPPLLLAIAGRYVLQPELLLMSVARNFRRRSLRRRRRRPLLLRRRRRRQGNSFAPRAANEETVLVLVLVKGSHDRQGKMGMGVVRRWLGMGKIVLVVEMTLVAAADEFCPDSTAAVRGVSVRLRVRSPGHLRGRRRGRVLVGLCVLVVLDGGLLAPRRRCRARLRLLLGLHPPVLEPDLDLALGEPEAVGDLDAAPPGEVAVVVELLLKLEGLVARVGLPRSLWTVLTQF